eukprot:TRINITY_DN41056_c0_g1_i1.p1 TRINITY_DN41056_c0_g1~~TRINITY_DN41056_c0_g1_i1.p1  ORF type:complete len:3335 (+),score=785.03 TRINITY_DN41056_c0_g1_i1:162-10166(+)
MAIRGAAVTPVLQSHGQTAVITSSKRRGLFPRTPLRGEQQQEAPMLSLGLAEEMLHGMESGSVLAFINSEPSQGRSGGHGASRSSNRHQLFISFKYRRTLIHFEYYWVHLKIVCRDARRSVFHTEQRHFDVIVELFNVFIPTLRSWLSAIVKAANFIDNPVESVDLRTMLKVRHHLLLTRSTAMTASVVLCKLDAESNKIVSKGIVFDFKARRVRDDAGNSLRSFSEVFQQFLGLYLGNPLLPSPREEDGDEPDCALDLLEGLEVEGEETELRIQRLLRLQQMVRQECARQRDSASPASSKGSEASLGNLELMTTLLLPHLIHGVPPLSAGHEPTPRGPGGATDGRDTLRTTSDAGAEQLFGGGPFGRLQVLVCDILADLCELSLEVVAPHVWRMCQGYLEDPATWHFCLAALNLLTELTPQLAAWLVLHTDAAARLFSIFTEGQQLLCSQREAALAAIGRGPQPLQPARQTASGKSYEAAGHDGHRTTGPRLPGRTTDWGSPPAPPMPQPRRPPPLPHVTDAGDDQGPSMGHESSSVPAPPPSFVAGSDARWALGSSHSPSSAGTGPGQPRQALHRRAPSFDNFQGPGRGDAADARRFGGTRGDRLSSGEEGGFAGVPAADGGPGAAKAGIRPLRVPPLNLGLASRLPCTDTPVSGGGVSKEPAGLPYSLTRSSRRLRQKELKEKLMPSPSSLTPSQAAGTGTNSATVGSRGQTQGAKTPASDSAGGVSLFTSLANSISMPLLGIKFLGGCTLSPSTTPSGGANAFGASSVAMKGGSVPLVGAGAPSLEQRAMQQADDMAKALGEAALLADLSCILKYRRERQVHDAVLQSMPMGFNTPIPRRRGESDDSLTRQRSADTFASAGGLSQSLEPSSSKSAGPASALRATAQGERSGSSSVPVPYSFAGAAAAPPLVASMPTPREHRGQRQLALRRVRLHAGLVLGGLGRSLLPGSTASSPSSPSKRQLKDASGVSALSVLGQHIPVSKLFEMLQASCARSGGCSFSFQDEEELGDAAGGSASTQALPVGGDVLAQRLPKHRLRRLAWLSEQVKKSATVRRCVCGASTLPRAGATIGVTCDDFCSCVDDVLASCIWWLLSAHAGHVRDIYAANTMISSPSGAQDDGLLSLTHAALQPPSKLLEGVSNAWHVRAAMDVFLVRLSRALGNGLMQLRSVQASTTAGQEAVAWWQQRLAFLLRLCSSYVRCCGNSGRVLTLQAFEALKPVLMALKFQICLGLDPSSAGLLSAPALRLWVAYLQLAGVLLKACMRYSGLHSAALAEALLLHFLDFEASSRSIFARSGLLASEAAAAAAAAGASARSHPGTSNSLARSLSSRTVASSNISSSSTRVGTSGADGLKKSHSVRSLPNGPPRLPASSFGSTTASATPSTPGVPRTAGRAQVSAVWCLLPRVLERALCDSGLDETFATAKSRTAVGEESAESVRCRVLGFVEALLEVSRVFSGSGNKGAGGAQGGGGGEVDGEEGGNEDSATGSGNGMGGQMRKLPTVLGVQDDFRCKTSGATEVLIRSLLDWLEFLFLPPSGLLCRLARKLPLAGGPLVDRLVNCELALFRVPAVVHAVYVREAFVSEYYVRRHFLAFVRLYNSRSGIIDGGVSSEQQLARLCRLHAETLLAIASLLTESDLPRRAFHRMSVLDFLAGEVDLEHETTQVRSRFLRKAEQAHAAAAAPSPSVMERVLPAAGSGGPGGANRMGVPSPQLPTMPEGLAGPPPAAIKMPPGGLMSEPGSQGGGSSSGGLAASGLAAVMAEPMPIVGPALDVGPPAPVLAPPVLGVAQPKKKLVPSLRLRGLPVSLQGCSGLGAPPPEEPGYGFGDAAAPGAAPMVLNDGTQAASGPLPATAAPSDEVDSSDESDSDEEAQQAPSTAAVALPPGPGPLALGTASEPVSDAPERPAEATSSTTAAAPAATTAPGETGREEDHDSDSSSGYDEAPSSLQAFRPMAAPKKVPGLSFAGLRPSLQGCSGLGAPPPEEPGMPPGGLGMLPGLMNGVHQANGAAPALLPGPLAGPALMFPAASGSSAATASVTSAPSLATGADVRGALAPPPPSEVGHSDSAEEAAGASPSPEDATASAVPVTGGGPRRSEGATVDSSDDDSSSNDGGGEQPSRGMPDLPPGPILVPSSGGLHLGLPHKSGGLKLVPKLSFNGLRPSLQGCTGLGAPPPEEPILGDQAHGVAPVHAAASPPVPPPGAEPMVRKPGAGLPPIATSMAGEEQAVCADGTPLAAAGGGAGRQTSSGGCVDPGLAGFVVRENVFYFKGRQRRRIYDDVQLHALMLTLILALLVTPKKGLLDSRYCEQYPLQSHKRNIPFLLSLHLNHAANRAVLPWLSQHVEQISHIGGFRLLKLLCESAMHRWMYSNWNRVAGGAFGTVYQCAVRLSGDDSAMPVAVKQIPKQNNIQDRCVFFDVFSEIACLDTIRFEKKVCQIFDYGVDESGYWIVMKYYATTLKKWRDSITGSMSENLPVLLAVFKQVMQAVQTLHSHGVVHYDLKCDNIMLDFERGEGGELLPQVFLSEDDASPESAAYPLSPGTASSGGVDEGRYSQQAQAMMAAATQALEGGTTPAYSPAAAAADACEAAAPRIAIADFGESRMFATTEELDLRNRGTEIIKCPEMLDLENFGRRDGVNFDRRKRVGTDQSADIWSLGCLCFELLTGRFLFQDDDLASFWARVTGKMGDCSDGEVVSLSSSKYLENNGPILDFLNYLLVRDPKRRPVITLVVKKFETLAPEALAAARLQGRETAETQSSGSLPRRENSGLLTPDSPRSVAGRSVGGSSGGPYSHAGQRPDRPLVCAAAGEAESYITKVFRDLSVLEASDEDLRLVAGDCLGSLTASDASGNARDAGAPAKDEACGESGAGAWSSLQARLRSCPWTHIVDCRPPGAAALPPQLDVSNVFRLPWSQRSRPAEELVAYLPAIFDFLRQAAISKGMVLFVDGTSSASTSSPEQQQGEVAGLPDLQGARQTGRGGLAMAAILALVAEVYRIDVFLALSYLSSQCLVAAIRPDAVAAVARWQEADRRPSQQDSEEKVRIACLCGACSWHVPYAWLEMAGTKTSRGLRVGDSSIAPLPGPLAGVSLNSGAGAYVVECSCSSSSSSNSGSGSSSNSRCPCPGNCQSYARWMTARLGLRAHNVHWLWLPEGVKSIDFADGPEKAIAVTRGLAAAAECISAASGGPGPVAAPAQAGDSEEGILRYRCRSCQVLTHAEVPVLGTQAPLRRTALVLSYELERWARYARAAEVATAEAASSAGASARGFASATAAATARTPSAAALRGQRRPPMHLHSVALQEVVLPRPQRAGRSVAAMLASSRSRVASAASDGVLV